MNQHEQRRVLGSKHLSLADYNKSRTLNVAVLSGREYRRQRRKEDREAKKN